MVSLKEVIGFELRTKDGGVGRISDFLIDERNWTAKYAVVPVGGFLSGERLMIPVGGLVLAGEDRALTSPKRKAALVAMSPMGLLTKAEEGWAALNDQSPPHNPASFTPEPRSPWRSCQAMLGCNVAVSDGACGSLDDLLVDFEKWQVLYFVGRSYSWKKKSSVLIPAAWVEHVSWKGETMDVSVSKDALEREPSFKPASHKR